MRTILVFAVAILFLSQSFIHEAVGEEAKFIKIASITGEEVVYPFTAYTLDSPDPAYRGEYRVKLEGTLVSEEQSYATIDGLAVYRMQSVFDLATMKPVSFESEDLRRGRVQKASLDKETLEFEISHDGDAQIQKGKNPWGESFYLWPNIIHVARHNWVPIANGSEIPLNLYVISRKSHYGFNLRKVDEGLQNGVRVIRMELAASSFLLRAFLNPIVFTFSQDDPSRLLEYSGKSAVVGENGKRQNLRIVMDPPLSSERKTL